MRKWGRIVAALALAIVLALTGTVYWLFYDNRMPTEGSFPLDLAELRHAASSLPGRGPERIEVEELSHTYVPKIAIVAGTTWDKIDMLRASYRLVYPGRSIVIDTGNSLKIARQFDAARYDLGAWDRIQRALDSAAAIVVTHEHADHMGGLIESPHLAAILPQAKLLPEQINSGERSAPLLWPADATANYRPLRYTRLYPLAPGVVLVRAPGHTPGSQMVYVRRADGREFMFMGDVASNADNVAMQRIRSRYVTNHLGTRDDRRAVMLETQALGRLSKQDPALVLVPGHDAVAIERLIGAGLLVRGFRL